MDGQGGPRGNLSVLATNGEWHQRYTFRRPGLYVLRARAFGQQAGPDVGRAEFRLNGRRVKRVEMGCGW